MYSVSHSGNFNKIDRFLRKMSNGDMYDSLEGLAREGVDALASLTPEDTGLTAASWYYEIDVSRGSCSITWLNSNIQNGFAVAIGLQYGHGTGTGGWVNGQDYINPAIKPIMDKILNDVWKVVTSA